MLTIAVAATGATVKHFLDSPFLLTSNKSTIYRSCGDDKAYHKGHDCAVIR
jgi:hypothetical protein